MARMLMPLRRYADFQGRLRRKEYSMLYFLTVLVLLPLYVWFAILGAVASSSGAGYSPWVGLLGLVMAVVLFGLAIPSLPVQVRRFHDQDKTGWFVLLALIPAIGGIIVLVFNCLDGTRGPNRCGDDPKFDLSATFS